MFANNLGRLKHPRVYANTLNGPGVCKHPSAFANTLGCMQTPWLGRVFAYTLGCLQTHGFLKRPVTYSLQLEDLLMFSSIFFFFGR